MEDKIENILRVEQKHLNELVDDQVNHRMRVVKKLTRYCGTSRQCQEAELIVAAGEKKSGVIVGQNLQPVPRSVERSQNCVLQDGQAERRKITEDSITLERSIQKAFRSTQTVGSISLGKLENVPHCYRAAD